MLCDLLQISYWIQICYSHISKNFTLLVNGIFFYRLLNSSTVLNCYRSISRPSINSHSPFWMTLKMLEHMSTVYYTYILKIISFQTEKRRTFWINKSYFQNLILVISKWVTLLTSGVRDWREWAEFNQISVC